MSVNLAWDVWNCLKTGGVYCYTGIFGNGGNGNLEKIWLAPETWSFECGIYLNENPEPSKVDQRLTYYPNKEFTGMYLQDAVAMLNKPEERKKYKCPPDAVLVIHLCHCRVKVEKAK